jgi:hypothetical protein
MRARIILTEAKRTPKQIIQAIRDLVSRYDRVQARFTLATYARTSREEVSKRYDKLYDKLLRELERTDKKAFDKFMKTIPHHTWTE